MGADGYWGFRWRGKPYIFPLERDGGPDQLGLYVLNYLARMIRLDLMAEYRGILDQLIEISEEEEDEASWRGRLLAPCSLEDVVENDFIFDNAVPPDERIPNDNYGYIINLDNEELEFQDSTRQEYYDFTMDRQNWEELRQEWSQAVYPVETRHWFYDNTTKARRKVFDFVAHQADYLTKPVLTGLTDELANLAGPEDQLSGALDKFPPWVQVIAQDLVNQGVFPALPRHYSADQYQVHDRTGRATVGNSPPLVLLALSQVKISFIYQGEYRAWWEFLPNSLIIISPDHQMTLQITLTRQPGWLLALA